MNSSNRNIRLKIKEIIDDIDSDDIKSFLIQYAGADKAFEMAFKSHFISRVRTSHDESNKYRRLLDELVKPKNAHNKIGPSQKKVISIVLKDLALQMNDCLSTDDYTEAYYLGKECIDKVAYLQNRYLIKDKNIEQCRVQFLAGISVILEKQLAPAFRERIESELKLLVNRSYYIPKSFNLIEVLNASNVLVREDKETLIDNLKAKVKSLDEKNDTIKTLVQLCHPFKSLARDLMLDFSHELIYRALLAMIKEGKFEYVDFYIDNPEIGFSFNTDILRIFKFIEKEEQKALTKALNALESSEYSIIQLREICEAVPDLYLRQNFEKIRSWIDGLPFTLSSMMYAKGRMDEELIQMLYDKMDIEWIKVYDQILLERGHREKLIDLYKTVIEDYISSHIGKKSREYLERLQSHLIALGESSMYKKLFDFISEKYAHRISLNA